MSYKFLPTLSPSLSVTLHTHMSCPFWGQGCTHQSEAHFQMCTSLYMCCFRCSRHVREKKVPHSKFLKCHFASLILLFNKPTWFKLKLIIVTINGYRRKSLWHCVNCAKKVTCNYFISLYMEDVRAKQKQRYREIDQRRQIREFVGVSVVWSQILICICTFRIKIYRIIPVF